jgi:hypothetical protein
MQFVPRRPCLSLTRADFFLARFFFSVQAPVAPSPDTESMTLKRERFCARMTD